ncbi:Cardiolipin synthase [subsurface metagenome]
MTGFDLRRDKNPIKDAIDGATKFINIVSFQFTSEKIIKLLIDKAHKGIEVRVITLPEDSYRDVTKRQQVSDFYKELSDSGIELNLCMWEVGVPELTETSLSGKQTEGGGNKWYSLHGKFVVTDKVALVLSTNFTDEEQLEAYLCYEDSEIIKSFRAKFNKINELFCFKQEALPGSLYNQLPPPVQKELESLYKTSKRINIKKYPSELAPDVEIKRGLFLSPFEGKARTFFNNIINQAEQFIYLSTERLFDDQVVKVLLNKAYRTDIPIKIITGHPRKVRQNPSKAEKMVADLMAAGIDFTIIDDIHAKFWLTDKWVSLGSANLSKMNLGFVKTGNCWRANTETLWFDNNDRTISIAKNKYEEIFESSKSGIIALADVGTKVNKAKDLFAVFGFKSKKEAKIIMARIETQFTVENRQNIVRIAKLSARLAEIENVTFIIEEHVIMANILFYLRERKHDISEIQEKMADIINKQKIANAIEKLRKRKYIVKEHDFYTINIERLLVREERTNYSMGDMFK